MSSSSSSSQDDLDLLDQELNRINSEDESSDEELNQKKSPIRVKKNKRKRAKLAQFIDDEAQLSSEDEDKVSSDEFDESDDDGELEDLVDRDAQELDSDQEEEVRGLYHKQLEQEDKRDVLLLREHLEDNAVAVGQARRRKFRWQTKELMENSLKRHYDPDDEDDEADDDDDLDVNYEELRPKLRRPDAETLLIKSTQKFAAKSLIESKFSLNDDSNSFASRPLIAPNASSITTSDISQFVFKDKEMVQALSNRESVTKTREEKDKIIQREINRVLQAKSIFDELYS